MVKSNSLKSVHNEKAGPCYNTLTPSAEPSRRVAPVYGSLALHMVEKVRTEPSAAHSTLRERVPAGTVLPADGSDGCLGLMDDGRARRLDGATDDRRQHHCLR